MFILCDTSSILLLLRIAPDMFRDERFQCKTILDVHDEIFRTSKFKTKYPWIKELRARIKPIVLNEKQKVKEKEYFDAIKTIIDMGTINSKTNHLFDLSYTDMRVLSHALTLEYKITSCDRNLVQFACQEFEEDFTGNVFPLEIINYWLESGVIQWNEEKQLIIRSGLKTSQCNLKRQRERLKRLLGLILVIRGKRIFISI